MRFHHRLVPLAAALRLALVAALPVALVAALPLALAAQPADHRALEREILKQLVEINTSDSAGRTAEAAQAMARRLVGAGFSASDVRVLGPSPRYQSLVARYR